MKTKTRILEFQFWKWRRWRIEAKRLYFQILRTKKVGGSPQIFTMPTKMRLHEIGNKGNHKAH